MDTLYDLATKKWDNRFEEIQQIALNDMNAIIATEKYINTSRIDRRLLQNFPVYIRVVLTWNTDDCDIDLWVTDPDGEKCFYGNKLTQNGGRISRDFTQGYGPEEFCIKQAVKGKYKIEANYYGTHSQKNLLPQFLRKKSFDYDNAVTGMRQILWGLAKKVIIADSMGYYVDQLFACPFNYSATSMIWAGVLFAVQIYADFSGYSDIAIGSARLLNIRLQPNFRFPFFSRNMKELWQRWHISLMTWFRHYVYFPLGGSRRGKWRTALNTMIVFSLSGLWHGADWTFVIWGTVNGLLLLPFIFMPRKKLGEHATLRDIPRCLLTFFLFAMVFIAFRANGITHLGEVCSEIIKGEWLVWPAFVEAIYYIVPFFVVEWLGRKQEFPLMQLPFPKAVRWIIYWGLLLGIALASLDRNTQFIYFQF